MLLALSHQSEPLQSHLQLVCCNFTCSGGRRGAVAASRGVGAAVAATAGTVITTSAKPAV